MGNFLSYSIISGLLMLAIYLAYRVLLARENQHGYNRVILLLIYAVSFSAVPLLALLQGGISHPLHQTVSIDGLEAVDAVVNPSSDPAWGTILIWIFIAGMVVVVVKTIVTWFKIIGMICTGERIKHDGYSLVIVDNDCYAPFCWMRYVVISRNDYNGDNMSIIIHELKHVRCCHWVDLLIAQTVCILNWFNPAAWLMRDELMLVHEYQADMAVIDSGIDIQRYQLLLIKKAVGARFPSLANSLNHSKLKKRITMMYKEKSGAGRKIKALALVPILVMALGVTAVPSVRAAVSTIRNSDVSVGKSSEKSSSDKARVQIFKVTNLNNDGNVTTVTIKGEGLGNNLTVSGGTFKTAGKTYQAKSLRCNMTDGMATIKVVFPFMSEWENSSMTLTVNGDEIPFNLENFFDNAQTINIGDDPSCESSSTRSSFVFSGDRTSFLNDFTIYVDGENVTEQYLASIPSERVASITVSADNQELSISLKK